MKRVITAAVLIPLVLLLLLKGSFLMVVLLSTLVACLAAWEYLVIADAHGAQTPRILVLVAIVLLYAAVWFGAGLLLPVLGLESIVLLIVCGFRSPIERVLADTAYSVFALLYLGLTLATLPLIWAMKDGPALLVLLFCVVWTGDVAALYVGRAFGRQKLAPRLSPNKSWEGSAASLAGSLLVTATVIALGPRTSMLRYPGSLVYWLLLATLLNVSAQVGDLVESAIKRGAGVKDSGAMLPGHGGLLDRIDALLLAAPALWYALWIHQQFQQVSVR